MITIELNPDDAKFLLEQLAMQRRHVETELVHTDVRSLQSDLARDLARLDQIRERIASIVEH